MEKMFEMFLVSVWEVKMWWETTDKITLYLFKKKNAFRGFSCFFKKQNKIWIKINIWG